jgi:hypothetical protein
MPLKQTPLLYMGSPAFLLGFDSHTWRRRLKIYPARRREMDAAREEMLLPLITFPMIGRDLIDFG